MNVSNNSKTFVIIVLSYSYSAKIAHEGTKIYIVEQTFYFSSHGDHALSKFEEEGIERRKN